MTRNRRVLNLTTGDMRKFRAAERAVEMCSASWVEYGVSIRNLSVLEAIAARNTQAANRELLASHELKHLSFEPPASGIEAFRRSGALAVDAEQFVFATKINNAAILEAIRERNALYA